MVLVYGRLGPDSQDSAMEKSSSESGLFEKGITWRSSTARYATGTRGYGTWRRDRLLLHVLGI